MYISEVGGSESAFRQAPRNREIVSFRACVRRAMSGCEVEFRCKSVAGALSLFPFGDGRLSLFPWDPPPPPKLLSSFSWLYRYVPN